MNRPLALLAAVLLSGLSLTSTGYTAAHGDALLGKAIGLQALGIVPHQVGAIRSCGRMPVSADGVVQLKLVGLRP